MSSPSGEWSPSTTAFQNLSGKTIGRFSIDSLLGSGGMGEVYLATDTVLKRQVALKRVSPKLHRDPQYKRLLLKEAERLSRVNHEGIARLHDVFEANDETFLVMEFVEGDSLRAQIGKRMPIESFLSIARQCLDALSAAHASSILHRDIKPENIIITPAGQVKLCDFGLAKRMHRPDETTGVDTADEGLRGTPAYMSPEALVSGDVDARSDLFSLGVVFYEVLSGRHPFLVFGNYISTVNRVLNSKPEPIAKVAPGVSANIASIVDRMLAKDPSKRPATAEDVKAALKTAIRPLSRMRLLVLAGLLLLAVLSTVLLLSTLRTPVQTASSTERTLVVLAFRAIGQSSETQFYSDGLTEALTARLARLNQAQLFTVAPASEVRARKITTAEDARRFFGANVILSGTLQQVGDTVRLNYTLFDANSLKPLDGDSLAASSNTPFELEDKLTERVATSLKLHAAAARHDTKVGIAYENYLRGRGYLQGEKDAGQIGNAIGAFQKAIDIDPTYASAYAGLGTAYSLRYDITKESEWLAPARTACEKSVALDNAAADGKICTGIVQTATGQYEKAVTSFEQALDAEPTNDLAYRSLAQAHEYLEHFDDAERTLRRAIQLNPRFALGYARLGAFYNHRARYQEAAEQYRQQIDLVPDDNEAYRAASSAYLYLGDYEEGISLLKRSIQLRPTGGALSNLGSTYMRLKRFDDAIPVFEQAIQLAPRIYGFAGNLARAYYWSSKQRGKAADAYQHAIALASERLVVNDRDADAHISLAQYYAMIGDRTQSSRHLATAMKLRPEEAEYYSIAAVIHNQFGDRSSALSALKKAVSLKWSIAEIKTEIEFDNLRTDPEFKKLTKELQH